MSRTPVREAFLRLEGEGLLRLYPKRGALVGAGVGRRGRGRDGDAHAGRALRARQGAGQRAAPEIADAHGGRDRAAGGVRRGGRRRRLRGRRPRVPHASSSPPPATRSSTGLYDSLRDRQQRMIITSLLLDAKRSESILVEHRRAHRRDPRAASSSARRTVLGRAPARRRCELGCDPAGLETDGRFAASGKSRRRWPSAVASTSAPACSISSAPSSRRCARPGSARSGPDTLIAAHGRPVWSNTAAATQPTPSSCSSLSSA